MKLSDAMATGSPSSTPTRHTWSGSGAHRSTRYLATRARGRSSGVPLNASSITSATRRTSSPRSARTVTAPPPETGMSARSNALCSEARLGGLARRRGGEARAARTQEPCAGFRAGEGDRGCRTPPSDGRITERREGRRRARDRAGHLSRRCITDARRVKCPRVPGVPARLASPDANVDDTSRFG